MPRKQIRMWDPTTHGGVIVSGSFNTRVNTRMEARLTDLHACPIHGVNVISSCSDNTVTNNLGNARLWDSCACGALICDGSPNTTDN